MRCMRRKSPSWRRVVTRGWPERGRSLTVPDCWNRSRRRIIVRLWQLYSRATSVAPLPALNIPSASERSCCVNRGMFTRLKIFLGCCFFHMPIPRAHIDHSWCTLLEVVRAPRAINAKQPNAMLNTRLVYLPVFLPTYWHFNRGKVFLAKNLTKKS